MTFGVTSDGFIKKTLTDIISDKQTKAQEIFGVNADLTPSSPIEQFLECCAIEEAILWDVLEDVYYAGYVDTASGASLDQIATLVGIERIPAAYASGIVRFTGISGANIPQFSRVSTPDAIAFKTLLGVNIPAGLSVDIGSMAEEVGEAGNVEASAINSLVQPIAGVVSVTNPNPFTQGKDLEIDADLRYRVKGALARASVATLSGIVANVRTIDGVYGVYAEEDLVAHTATLVVDGGNDLAITNMIAETRPAGIQVFLTRPVNLNIYINADIVQDGSITSTSIVETIADYINGLDVGQDVSFATLIHLIMNMDGMLDVDLSIGTSYPPSEKTNLSVPSGQVPYTNSSLITVT